MDTSETYFLLQCNRIFAKDSVKARAFQ